MASRRATIAPNSLKNVSGDSQSSRNVANKANGGNAKKAVKSSGKVVKSRYMQSADKTSLSKSNSQTSESTVLSQQPLSPKATFVKPKVVSTPPRRSVAQQPAAGSMVLSEMDPSLLGNSILQSTLSDGHCFRPDFDISVIRDIATVENAAGTDKNPEIEKRTVDMQTFLLAYLTAKMDHNTAKLKAEAEERLFQEMEAELTLHNEVKEKKRMHLLGEKKRHQNETLDLLVDTMTPVAELANQFTNDYQSFAAAVDATRHELPVKNFCINGDGRHFLVKAEALLKESELLLLECTCGDEEENRTSLECLREMKTASNHISQHLSGTFSELLELSSLVCRHSVQRRQTVEEEELGTSRICQLFCPK